MATPFAEAAYKAATEAKDVARPAMDQAEAQIVATHTAYLKAVYDRQQAERVWRQLDNSDRAGVNISSQQLNAAVDKVNQAGFLVEKAEDAWRDAQEAKRAANDKASEAFANWRQAAKLLEGSRGDVRHW